MIYVNDYSENSREIIISIYYLKLYHKLKVIIYINIQNCRRLLFKLINVCVLFDPKLRVSQNCNKSNAKIKSS